MVYHKALFQTREFSSHPGFGRVLFHGLASVFLLKLPLLTLSSGYPLKSIARLIKEIRRLEDSY